MSRLGRRKKRVKRTQASACDGKVRYQTRDAANALDVPSVAAMDDPYVLHRVHTDSRISRSVDIRHR